MAARKPAPASAQAGNGKVSAVGALVAAVLAAIGGTAFFIQSDRLGPAPTTHQALPPPTMAEPPATRPTVPATTPTISPTPTMPEKIDKSTKPKPPPRDPG